VKAKLNRAVRFAAMGGAVAGTAAAAAVAASPVLRDELRRFGHLARPLHPREPGAPVPPPLPEGRVVNLPGRGEVFIRDTGGDLPPVLLLHGWTLSADLNFFAVFGPLSQRHRVVALDLRGHGRGLRSPEPFSLEDCADDAAALLEVLGLGPAVVVGFSLGGAVAMLLCHRHPERVAGLVFSATALDWQDSAQRLVWRSMALFEVALRNGTGDGIAERVVRDIVEECPELEPYADWATGEFRRGYPTDLAGAGRALSAYDGRPLAPGVDVPASVVVTAQDQLVRPQKQRELALAVRARVFELDADHTAPFNRGREFALLLAQAVEAVSAS